MFIKNKHAAASSTCETYKTCSQKPEQSKLSLYWGQKTGNLICTLFDQPIPHSASSSWIPLMALSAFSCCPTHSLTSSWPSSYKEKTKLSYSISSSSSLCLLKDSGSLMALISLRIQTIAAFTVFSICPCFSTVKRNAKHKIG